jgi:kumamolisin
MSLHHYLKHPRTVVDSPWPVPALCDAYAWPSGLAGGGVIAIVELGGSWAQSDMASYFNSIGQPMPSITDCSADGSSNNGTNPDPNADFEVALDIQVAAASYFMATGKAATIRVYWAQDIASAITAATKDGCSVFSCSWGDDEANWLPADIKATEAAAAVAIMDGMQLCCAAGDNDSSDGGPNAANVDYPGSSASVICCGGTSKPAGGPEVVWNNNPGNSDGEGTGGGYSTLFPLPTWQDIAVTPPKGLGRGVPDVAANADPQTGYEIFVHGQSQVVGGTSAVAPLYAGLLAAFGKMILFVEMVLYSNSKDFADITQGNNGAYSAGPGWDPCTGWGVPIGAALAGTFMQVTPTPNPVPPPPVPPTMSNREFCILMADAAAADMRKPGQTVHNSCIDFASIMEEAGYTVTISAKK